MKVIKSNISQVHLPNQPLCPWLATHVIAILEAFLLIKEMTPINQIQAYVTLEQQCNWLTINISCIHIAVSNYWMRAKTRGLSGALTAPSLN
jgi:hypothetical protein